jgi:predicted DsbA family dithiol-disulfide isomerase
MTPTQISKRVVLDRLAWIDEMIGEIQALPLDNKEAFFADRRNIWTAEIAAEYGLSLKQVEAALAFWAAHQAEIENHMAYEERLSEA